MLQTAKTNAPSFQALVAANRAAGRLSETVAPDNSKKMQLAGMRLWPAELEQAKKLADSDERSLAWFCRRMYLRGLEAYLAEQGSNTAAAQ
jgi:hypothetical protein